MKRFVEGADRGQSTLLPECLDDWIDEDNPVRVIDAFVDALDLARLGFDGVEPAATGRPAFHPSVLLKLYIYGYLNRVQSSRRLECEAGRNLELLWLLGRLVPDHNTIADFRRDNGPAIKKACDRTGTAHSAMGARALLEAVQERLDGNPQAMRHRRETVEHPFGTIKARMGAAHFLTKTLPKVATEMAHAVLGYNLTRVLNIMGVKSLIAAMRG